MVDRPLPALLISLLTALLWSSAAPLAAQSSYFFPEGERFDAEVPSPEEFLGYELGTHHTRHDRVADYFQELARRSDRATYQEIGQTIGLRPMPVLTLTSPANHQRLEEIRQAHLEAADPGGEGQPAANRPVIVHLGYGVHGNETSSTEAAMLTAYWLAASLEDEVEQYLAEGVFHVEPVLNPDGRDRHTTWANMHKSDPYTADPLDREHNEVWPGGRTNHYWFDLNRDWLPLEQPESRARIDFHHHWQPNVVTDYHEMGTNSTYFFEPTEPELSWNHLLPERLYTGITLDFAAHYAEALDDLGSLYFTREDRFDNTYPGYGSTYPNFLGGLGLVFEQASARGHEQRSERHGVLTFPFAIRNHFRTSVATVQAAIEHREELLDYQRGFFASAGELACQDPVQAYVFGDPVDHSRNRAFVELLLRHRLEVYELADEARYGDHTFEPGAAWVVPLDQPHYRLVRSIFERTEHYTGRAGGRASAWTMSLAYGLPDAEVRDASYPRGAQVVEAPSLEELGRVARSSYAYLLDWADYAAPQALQHLLAHGVHAEAAFQPFTARTDTGPHRFSRGSISIPVQVQEADPATLHELVLEAEALAGVRFRSTGTGASLEGIDLGSGSFQPVREPRALMVVGAGVNSGEAGEVWHLLDTRVGLPITKVDRWNLARARLSDYDVLVLVSGAESVLDGSRAAVDRWVRDGGTLIALGTAADWAARAGLAPHVKAAGEPEEEEPGALERRDYAVADSLQTWQRISGIIVEVDLDVTHPLGFGYTRRRLPVWRSHGRFLPRSTNPYSTVARYTEEPRLSGFITEGNLERLSGSASVLADRLGSGSVVLFLDNPNFRGFWYGTNRLFLNAIYLGRYVRVPG